MCRKLHIGKQIPERFLQKKEPPIIIILQAPCEFWAAYLSYGSNKDLQASNSGCAGRIYILLASSVTQVGSLLCSARD